MAKLPFNNRNAFNAFANNTNRGRRPKFSINYINKVTVKEPKPLELNYPGAVKEEKEKPLVLNYFNKTKRDSITIGGNNKKSFTVPDVGDPTSVTIANADSSAFNDTYNKTTVDGQVRYLVVAARYIFFDTGTSKWSLFNNSVIATLPASVTESDGFWSSNAWTGFLTNATYTLG